MTLPRIIPILLLDNQRLVKTQGFKKPVYVGDPINVIRIFNEKEVDELAIIDITARNQKRQPDLDFLSDLATEAFMPLSYGGGIKSEVQVSRLIRSGYEKVILQNALFHHQNEVEKMVKSFGSQAIVASLDFSHHRRHGYYVRNTRGNSRLSVRQTIQMAEEVGVGELLITSVDREGSRRGLDLRLLEVALQTAQRPVVFHGGASNLENIRLALSSGADAVAAGSLFVFSPSLERSVLLSYPSYDERLLLQEDESATT